MDIDRKKIKSKSTIIRKGSSALIFLSKLTHILFVVYYT